MVFLFRRYAFPSNENAAKPMGIRAWRLIARWVSDCSSETHVRGPVLLRSRPFPTVTVTVAGKDIPQ